MAEIMGRGKDLAPVVQQTLPENKIPAAFLFFGACQHGDNASKTPPRGGAACRIFFAAGKIAAAPRYMHHGGPFALTCMAV